MRMSKLLTKKNIIFFLIILAIILIVGFSYAYWQTSVTQSGSNTESFDCFNLTFSENVSGVDNINGVPQTDEEGLLNPYHEITITNTCKTTSTYIVKLHVLNTTTLDDLYTRISVDDMVYTVADLAPTVESSQSNPHANPASPTIKAKSRYILAAGELNYQDSKTYKIRTWMDEFTPEDKGSGKEFHSKITVETAAIYKEVPILAEAILGVDNSNVVTTGDGLYKGVGIDNQPTYYFKGSNPNNYLVMNGLEFRIIRINEDGSIRVVSSNATTPWRGDIENHRTFFNDVASSVYTQYTDIEHYYTTSASIYKWYNDNLLNTKYDDLVVEGNFCNDTTYPTTFNNFDCNVAPLKLKYGIITFNEFNLAGAGNGYLYKDTTYWTMTPATSSTVYFITTGVSSRYSTRSVTDGIPYSYPVINLKSRTKAIGNGSKENPYTIVY